MARTRQPAVLGRRGGHSALPRHPRPSRPPRHRHGHGNGHRRVLPRHRPRDGLRNILAHAPHPPPPRPSPPPRPPPPRRPRYRTPAASIRHPPGSQTPAPSPPPHRSTRPSRIPTTHRSRDSLTGLPRPTSPPTTPRPPLMSCPP